MRTQPGVYTPWNQHGRELCHPVNRSDFGRISDEINGTSRQSTWKPIRMRLIHEDQGQTLATSDSPWLGKEALIFRQNVIEALGQMLRVHGELLPLECSEADLVMYNPTKVIDALDEAASSVKRFGSGKIMRIDRYVFRENMIRDVDIFKIPNLRVSPTYVSHRFVDRWTASGLKGLEFKQVWAAPN